MVSVLALLGLANWPAMRPTLTTGTPDPYVSTTAIWRMTRSLSRMLSALKSWKDSAQSPAWSRNALPAATSASVDVRARASPANTNGGMVESCLSERSSAASSGQSGCCAAGRSLHDRGDHTVGSLRR
jgi:hypothetical protein